MTEIRSATQRQRDKIRSGKIVERLIAHVNGEIELTNSQVNAARILLGKVLPDMKSIEVDVHAELKTVSYQRLTDEQLMAIAAGGFQPEAIEGQCEAVQEPLKLVSDK